MDFILPNFTFKWSEDCIKYLGTKILRDLTDVFSKNFTALLAFIKLDCKRWSRGKQSWFGRCNAIKMTAFPRLLCIFQTLPINLPSSFLKDVTQVFTNFVWNYKRPRVPFRTLHRARLEGGLSFPDATLYYQACHLSRVIDCCRHAGSKQWVDIERSISAVHLPGLSWCSSQVPPSLLTHPTMGGWRGQCVRKSFLCRVSFLPHHLCTRS